MEAELREGVMATLDAIAGEFEAFRRLQEKLVEHRLRGEDLHRGRAQGLRGRHLHHRPAPEDAEAQQQPHRGPGRPALCDQPAPDRPGRAPAAPGRQLRHLPRRVPAAYLGSELDPSWREKVDAARHPLDQVRRERHRPDRRHPPRDRRAGHRVRPADRRLPPHRPDRAEGRARGASGQEGDGRGQPAPGDLDRQEIHQPRPAVPGSDPGRQHRPDEGGRQVRVPPRLQVLHLRHLVDPPGDHPLDRRPGAHHPHPGAHDRDDQQDRPHQPPDAARDRPRADARRSWPRSWPCRSRRCARC